MKKNLPALDDDLFAMGVLAVLRANPDDHDDATGERVLAMAGEALFPDDGASVGAFRIRFIATLALLDHPDFAKWVHGSEDTMFVHPALLCAAAGARVNHNGRFALRMLGRRIESLAADEYADWEWPDGNDGNE